MTKEESNKLQQVVAGYMKTKPNYSPKEITTQIRVTTHLLDQFNEYEAYQAVYYQYSKLMRKQIPSYSLTKPDQGKVITFVGNERVDIKEKSYHYKTKPQIVGVIADTHEPFTHPQYRAFCEEVFNRHKVTKIVHIGDEVDNYALSYHEKNPNVLSPTAEAERAQLALNKWYSTFPNVDVLVGNHGALPFRQATTAGIPKRYLKTYEQIWEAPKGWQWTEELVIDNVKYVHGIGSSGQTGAIDRAIKSRQSTVIGHLHAFGGVNYHASENDLIFGLNVGCGIDFKAYAFEYGKPFVNKPILGCGIVKEGFDAQFIPMNLGTKYVYKP